MGRPTLASLGLQQMLDMKLPATAVSLVLLLILTTDWSQIPAADLVELFCGHRMITSCAMRCGLMVRSLDLCVNKKHDICASAGFAWGPREAETVDFVHL